MNNQVLIVEDCFIQSTVLKKILESENFGVTAVCRSGDEALSEIQKAKPDLILMDVYLKGDMNGVQAVKKIREQLEVPVIFITALNDTKLFYDIQTIINSGLLQKPVSKSDLVGALHTFISATAVA
ncbi:MAG: response regulator [Balneolaceae bacterium]|nr:response regulator [Balneolaceae bacterium]